MLDLQSKSSNGRSISNVCDNAILDMFYIIVCCRPPFPWPGILQVTEDPPGCPQVCTSAKLYCKV